MRAEVARLDGCIKAVVVVGHRCTHCGSAEHGRPRVSLPDGHQPPHVSVSRTRGLTVVAVSDVGAVGVDVEPVGAASFDGFDAVALHPDERATDAVERTRLWVRKEAVLKATGDGLRADPRELRVDPSPRVVLADGATVWVRDIDLDGYAFAVAVLTETAPEISVRAAPAAACVLQPAVEQGLRLTGDLGGERLEHRAGHGAVAVPLDPGPQQREEPVVADREPQRVQQQRTALVDPVVEHQVRAGVAEQQVLRLGGEPASSGRGPARPRCGRPTPPTTATRSSRRSPRAARCRAS